MKEFENNNNNKIKNENNSEFKLLIDHEYRDTSKDYDNNDKEIIINYNHDSSKYKTTQYWRTRINLGLFAIVFLEIIFAFGYFPYTIYYAQLLHLSFSFLNFIILLIFHFIFIITQICLFKTTFTDPGSIPHGFPDSETFKDYDIQFFELNSSGVKRKCVKCQAYKPDRTHHCSRCKRCILKMDHHCPFVNNCVGFFNYKYFVLFLSWSTVLCFYILVTTVDNFKGLIDIHHTKSQPSIILGIVFITALVFGVGMSFFSSTHYRYILFNETTIEHFEKNSPNSNHPQSKYNTTDSTSSIPKKPRNIYDINYTFNFQQVFGNSPWKWFFPVQNDITPISGLVFHSTQSEKKLFY